MLSLYRTKSANTHHFSFQRNLEGVGEKGGIKPIFVQLTRDIELQPSDRIGSFPPMMCPTCPTVISELLYQNKLQPTLQWSEMVVLDKNKYINNCYSMHAIIFH